MCDAPAPLDDLGQPADPAGDDGRAENEGAVHDAGQLHGLPPGEQHADRQIER